MFKIRCMNIAKIARHGFSQTSVSELTLKTVLLYAKTEILLESQKLLLARHT